MLHPPPSSSSSYTGCTQESGFNFTNFMSAKNQITESGFSYDGAGNMIAAPSATYTYNAENQLVSAGGVTYGYDGDGKRVTKAPSSAPTQPNYIYWYGRDSSPVIDTDGAGHFQYRYISFNGMRVSREEANDWVDHYGLDALGNVRFVYGLNGTSDSSDYYPFGGERVLNSGTNNHYKFTGKERDSESGLDSFGARYMSSIIGRFVSPDRYNSIVVRQGMKAGGLPEEAAESFFDGFLENPQNWNEYSYGLNNPLRFIDPTGDAPQDGHHLLVERDTLFRAGTLARDFANAIKTGPLSGNGDPNNGFTVLHRQYNEAVKQMLNQAVQEEGPLEGWTLQQWKDFANSVLNSAEPAIKNFLDELEANNPGAKAALAASIARYRVSAAVIARVIATALVRNLFRVLILCVTCDEASRQQMFRPDVTHKLGTARPLNDSL